MIGLLVKNSGVMEFQVGNAKGTDPQVEISDVTDLQVQAGNSGVGNCRWTFRGDRA